MKKHIPNTITCCNLISGCIATYWAFCGVWDIALLFIVIGAIFDFFDGMSARLLGVSSLSAKNSIPLQMILPSVSLQLQLFLTF